MAAKRQVTLTSEAYEALSAGTAFATGVMLKRVTMSTALIAMSALARNHRDEFGALLAAAKSETG